MNRSWAATRDPWPVTSRKCRGSMNKLNQIFPNKRHNSHKPAAAGSAFTIYLWVSNIYLKSTHTRFIHYTLWEGGNKLKLILSIYSDGSSLLPRCHFIIGDSLSKSVQFHVNQNIFKTLQIALIHHFHFPVQLTEARCQCPRDPGRVAREPPESPARVSPGVGHPWSVAPVPMIVCALPGTGGEGEIWPMTCGSWSRATRRGCVITDTYYPDTWSITEFSALDHAVNHFYIMVTGMEKGFVYFWRLSSFFSWLILKAWCMHTFEDWERKMK